MCSILTKGSTCRNNKKLRFLLILTLSDQGYFRQLTSIRGGGGGGALLNDITARRFIVLYGLIINCSICVPVAKSNT